MTMVLDSYFLRLGALALMLAIFAPGDASGQRRAEQHEKRTIEPVDNRPSRKALTTRPGHVIPKAGFQHASNIIGDVDGNERFDAADIAQIRTALRFDQALAVPIADVSEPCNGTLDPVDGKRLLVALQVSRKDEKIISRCHGQMIGDEWQQPAPRTPPPLVTLDDLFAEIAREVPGFGGLYVDSGQTLKVVLVDPANRNLKLAQRSIDRTFGEERFAGLSVEAVAGDYDFQQLKNWKDRAQPLLNMAGVVSLDADERSNRVRLGIDDSDQQSAVEAAIEQSGVPLDAVAIELASRIRFDNHLLIPDLQRERRPLVGGMRIAVSSVACSLGFIAKWYGGPRGIVTNTHCTGTFSAPNLSNPTVASTAFQPASVPDESTRIGREALDPEWNCNGTCRLSDSTFIELDPQITGRLGVTGRSTHAYPAAATYKILGKAMAVSGDIAHRIGQTMGEAAGEVESTCISVKAPENLPASFPNREFIFNCQATYEADAAGGDSGGPVLKVKNAPNDEAYLLGIHVGRRTVGLDEESVYSPIANIESEIGELDVAFGNEAPDIRITSPEDGANIGPGAFPVVSLEAQVFDFEAGEDCDPCEVDWLSGKDGPLGVTEWAGGVSGKTATLGGGQGYRAITATAKDAQGKTAWDTIVVSTANSAPNVWIDWPHTNYQELYIFFPYTFQGSSFDNEDFHAIDCSKMTWSVEPDVVGGPQTGCSVQFTFTNVFAYGFEVTLTAEDDKGAVGEAKRYVQIVAPPANSGPSVIFTNPANNSAVPFQQFTTLTVIGTDPDGQSPISYAWEISGTSIGTPVTIGSTSGLSGAASSINWRPADNISSNCGAAIVEVTVTATDPSNQTGQASLMLEVLFPPC